MDGSANRAMPEFRFTHFAADAAATERVGETLGRTIDSGAVILLFGDLGAGKTTLTHGLGRGLEVSSPIQSPTFALIYEHAGRLLLAHMDLYRLESPNDLDALGIDDYLEGEGVVVIEWPEIAFDRLPASRLEIRLSREGTGRRIEALGLGAAAALAAEWQAGLSPT